MATRVIVAPEGRRIFLYTDFEVSASHSLSHTQHADADYVAVLLKLEKKDG